MGGKKYPRPHHTHFSNAVLSIYSPFVTSLAAASLETARKASSTVGCTAWGCGVVVGAKIVGVGTVGVSLPYGRATVLQYSIIIVE